MVFELDRLLFIYLFSSKFPKLLKHRRHVCVGFGLSPYVSPTTVHALKETKPQTVWKVKKLQWTTYPKFSCLFKFARSV